jgi:signal transduction histidine kinase
MGFYLQNGKVDSALYFHQQQLAYAKKLNMKLYEADAHEQIAYVLLWQLDLSEALKNYQTGLKIASDPNSAAISWGYQKFSYSKSPSDARLSIIGMIHYELSTLYQVSRMFEEQKREIAEALKIGTRLNNVKILLLATRDLGFLFAQKNQPDSALKYYKKALSYFDNYAYQLGIGTNYDNMAQVYITKQQYDSAKVYLRKAEKAVFISNDLITLCSSYLNFGRIYQKTNRLDSAIIYGFKTISLAKSIKSAQNVANGYTQLSHTYQLLNQPALALEYLRKGKSINDSINNSYTNKLILLQNAGFEEQMRLKKIADDQAAFQNQLKTIGLISVITIFLIIALILYRNNKQKQKTNKVLEQTLTNLKSTQSQLIQSEKMASLGELTAGIAHEIQNPLNFVNNFSEVSAELVKEMVEEVNKGNTEEVKAIANDVVQNLEKINHHGQRAADIVKGMLQHSRSSNGVKEPTDINALADEYLRLAYHGLRAKDKDFNATMKTDFDETIGTINIVPQDIGRVVLNLITNAFFVVNEKTKSGIENYEPTVWVSTKKVGDKVFVSVKDNGNGIPQKILDKIFQPFFTTKPTGQGTGLGLSLSYDIVKAHGGELKVETKEGEGTTFIISLPV